MKFKVDDLVRIVDPWENYINRKNVINQVGKITEVREMGLYHIEFFKELEGINRNNGHVYDDDELEKLTENEALAWLI